MIEPLLLGPTAVFVFTFLFGVAPPEDASGSACRLSGDDILFMLVCDDFEDAFGGVDFVSAIFEKKAVTGFGGFFSLIASIPRNLTELMSVVTMYQANPSL